MFVHITMVWLELRPLERNWAANITVCLGIRLVCLGQWPVAKSLIPFRHFDLETTLGVLFSRFFFPQQLKALGSQPR